MLNLQDSLLLYYTQAEVQFSIHCFLQMCLFEGGLVSLKQDLQGKKHLRPKFLWQFLMGFISVAVFAPYVDLERKESLNLIRNDDLNQFTKF